MTLDKHLLLPGQRYEARARVRASVGQWSDWTPVETWRTEEGESKKNHIFHKEAVEAFPEGSTLDLYECVKHLARIFNEPDRLSPVELFLLIENPGLYLLSSHF